jgi:ribosomal protein S1
MEFDWPPRWRGSAEDWEAIKRRFPLGSWAEGLVIARQPFGVFIDLGNETVGLMETPALPDPSTDEEFEYPAVGARLGGFVVRHRDSNFQVELVSPNPAGASFKRLVPRTSN